MTENSEPRYDTPAGDSPSAAAITEEMSEGTGYEQASAAPSAGERLVIELPDRQRTSPWRRVYRSQPDGAPARMTGGPSLIAALAAMMLAACVGGVVAIVLASPQEHRDPAPSSILPRVAAGRTSGERPHDRGASRRAKAPHARRTIIRPGSDSARAVPALPANTPAASVATSPAPSPSPAASTQPAETKRQTPGGPFSP
jgi:hypothetical protein